MKALRFDPSQNDQVMARLKAWESEVRRLAEKANPDLVDQLSYRSTVPLDLVPLRARRKMMLEYRDIIKFGPTLEALAGGPIQEGGAIGASKIASRLSLQGEKGKQFAKLPVRSDDSILSYIYSQLNIQHRPPRVGGTAFSHFGVSTINLPSVSMIENGMAAINRMRSGEAIMEHGSKYTLFDLETAGLDFGKIRELSYRTGQVGSKTAVDSTVHFRVAEFNRGMLADSGRPLPVEDWMRKKMGVKYASENMGDGDDFVKHFMPFLKQVQESKYLVGHNISKFDIQQVFVGLSGTKAYKRNLDMGDGINFRDYVDNIFKDLNGKVIDTLELAKAAPNLQTIKPAREIAARGSHSMFSIENLLLETDLLEKSPELKSLIAGQGLHTGSVDSAVTAALVEHLPSLKVKRAALGVDMRRSISSAAAITPFTKIRDHSQISDDLLHHLVTTGEGIETTDTRLKARLQRVASDPEKYKSEIKGIIKEIRSGKPVKFEVTPVLQEVFHSRDLKLTSAVSSPHTALPAIGRFDRITGRTTPYSGVLRKDYGSMKRLASERPTAKAFASLQKQFAEAGIPYAGLSFEERKIGYSLSRLTAGLESGINKTAAVFGADSLISRFESFDANTVKYASEYTDRLTIPLSMLQEMEGSRFAKPLAGESPVMLGFSPFEYTPSAGSRKYGVNLFYKFSDQQEALGISGHIESLAQKGDEDIARALGMEMDDPRLAGAIERFKASAPELISRLKDSSVMDRGIAVGQLHGDQGVAKQVYNLFTEFNDNLRAGEDVLGLAAPLIDSRDGVIRVGATVFDSLLGREGTQDLARLTSQAVGYLDETVTQIALNKSFNASAQLILKSGANEAGVKRILTVADQIAKVKPHLGKASAVTVAAGLGYYLYGRHKEKSMYGETMQQMPYEIGTSYGLKDQVDMDMMSGKSSRRSLDPLATASLVDILNQNKINHSSMAWDKNSSLYGGVL